MTDKNPKHTNKKNKMDFFNFLLEVFGWIRIVASPFLIGALIGFFCIFQSLTQLDLL